MTGNHLRLDRRHWSRALRLGSLLLAASPLAHACPACVPLVEAGIYGENFLRHLLLMVAPIGILLVIAVVVYWTGYPSGKGENE